MQAMCAVEHALTPGAQELAVAIEHHHRMLAAVEDIDAVLVVHRDGGDIREGPAVGNLRPVFDDFVFEVAGSESCCHGVLLLS